MKRSNIRLDEYSKKLWEQRKKEDIKESAENIVSLKNGQGLTSPASELPTEELKMVQQYMHRTNLLNLSKALPDRKKAMILRKFFKHKRNQQIEIYTLGEQPLQIIGKVNTIGRNFVTVTSLRDRIWIPFWRIESAKVPYGLPEVSSSHQHFVYDEELRKKLITRFSETVISKDVLLQQFFEETLETNLQTWKDTRVEIMTEDMEYIGKIIHSNDGKVEINGLKGSQSILLSDITLIKTVRFFHILTGLLRKKRSNNP
ncbi:hypothetical protein [Halalkalibacter sp. APA_J-10(15)]|uniref:hypothetical protein n=1 Tax=Halalkalibacter sp. APA_J-10(15) TaxID=2933805 RepID=UPI001FF27AE5|nr:hypothetical protein [Halalkalibacter sp. APA_J-10(15)]MCK0472463.1 hypothetical protein [Halalkalibacter sp. APA_J-10(15)]